MAKSNSSFIWINLFASKISKQNKLCEWAYLAEKFSCWKENILHNFITPKIIIRDLFLRLKALYLIEVLVPLGKVKHQIFKVIYTFMALSWSDSFLRTNLGTENRLLWPGRTVGGAEEGVPLRARRMKKEQRSTEDTMGVASRSPVPNSLQRMKDEVEEKEKYRLKVMEWWNNMKKKKITGENLEEKIQRLEQSIKIRCVC